jgi:hypothetical protein
MLPRAASKGGHWTMAPIRVCANDEIHAERQPEWLTINHDRPISLSIYLPILGPSAGAPPCAPSRLATVAALS